MMLFMQFYDSVYTVEGPLAPRPFPLLCFSPSVFALEPSRSFQSSKNTAVVARPIRGVAVALTVAFSFSAALHLHVRA